MGKVKLLTTDPNPNDHTLYVSGQITYPMGVVKHFYGEYNTVTGESSPEGFGEELPGAAISDIQRGMNAAYEDFLNEK